MLQPLAEIDEVLRLLAQHQGTNGSATADDVRRLTNTWISRSVLAAGSASVASSGGRGGGGGFGGGVGSGVGAESVLEVLGVRRAALESVLNQQLVAGRVVQVCAGAPGPALSQAS
jgi:hypothetical protein